MIQTLDVSMIPQSYLPEIRVSKNDNTMRTIKVNLIDENCDQWTPPAGASAVFTGTKPSGLGFTLPCTISGSAVTFVMLTTACNEVGRFPAEVRFTDGSGGRIGSCNVMMNVEWDPHSDDTTDGDKEELINEITALLEEIREEHQQAVEDITDTKTDALQDIGAEKDDALDAIAADVQAADAAAQRAQESADQAAGSERKADAAMDAWTNMSATAETLPAGSEASASYSEGVLSLGIPTGPEGTPGQDGVGIASVVLNADYTLTITLTDGRTYTTTSIRGEQGETGLTPDFTIGNVTTLEPGSQATATITGTDEEPVLNLGIPKGDPGEVTEAELLKLAVHDEASGSIASFADGSDGFPMDSLKVTLEPVQDLHGYDKPWAGGAGRNLLFIGGRTSGRIAEVQYTSDDNYIIGNGTKNGSGYANFTSLSMTLDAGTYYAKGFVISGTATGEVGAYITDGTSNLTSSSIFTGERSFTLEQQKTIYPRLAIWNDGTVLTNYKVGFVISKTSGIDQYYPYSNICPITGWDEVNTVVCGENLLASGDLTSGGYIDNNNGTVRTYSTWSYSGFIPVSPGRYRFMRLNNGVYERITGTNAYFAFYNEDKSFNTGNTGDNINFTSTNIKYLRVSAPTSYMNKIVLVADADASDFVNESDYIDGQFITTTLPQTVYGGTLDVVTGELVVDRYCADMGDMNFGKSGRTYGGFTGYLPKTYDKGNNSLVMECSSYAFDGYGNNNRGYYGANGTFRYYYNVVSGTNNEIYVKNEAYGDATAAQFTTAMTGQKIVFPLATPTTIQLTPQEIDTLLGDNNVWSDSGEVYVLYPADTKLYILKVMS